MASVGPVAPATSTEKHLKIRNHPVQNVSCVVGENPELSQPVHAAVKIKKKKKKIKFNRISNAKRKRLREMLTMWASSFQTAEVRCGNSLITAQHVLYLSWL